MSEENKKEPTVKQMQGIIKEIVNQHVHKMDADDSISGIIEVAIKKYGIEAGVLKDAGKKAFTEQYNPETFLKAKEKATAVYTLLNTLKTKE